MTSDDGHWAGVEYAFEMSFPCEAPNDYPNQQVRRRTDHTKSPPTPGPCVLSSLTEGADQSAASIGPPPRLESA